MPPDWLTSPPHPQSTRPRDPPNLTFRQMEDNNIRVHPLLYAFNISEWKILNDNKLTFMLRVRPRRWLAYVRPHAPCLACVCVALVNKSELYWHGCFAYCPLIGGSVKNFDASRNMCRSEYTAPDEENTLSFILCITRLRAGYGYRKE